MTRFKSSENFVKAFASECSSVVLKRHINTCMNKYLVQVRIKGQLVKTTIEADSTIHAKLIAEWHFGIGSVANTPSSINEYNHSSC